MCSLWFTYSTILSLCMFHTLCIQNGEGGCPLFPLFIKPLLLSRAPTPSLPETCKGTERLARTLPKEGFVHEGGLIGWSPLVYTYRQEIFIT